MEPSMAKPVSGPTPSEPLAEMLVRRENLRSRLAEEGVTIHVPVSGGQWEPPAVPFPVSADELSEMVVRLRRGDL